MRWPDPSKFPSALDFPEPPAGGAFLVNVTDEATRVVEESESLSGRNVRNAGAHAVTLSRDSELEAGKAYDVAAGAAVVVWLNAGETLWGRCADGLSTVLEVL